MRFLGFFVLISRGFSLLILKMSVSSWQIFGPALGRRFGASSGGPREGRPDLAALEDLPPARRAQQGPEALCRKRSGAQLVVALIREK